MAQQLLVTSVQRGVDANRIEVALISTVGGGISIVVTENDFNALRIEVTAGDGDTTSVADTINGDGTAALYVVASGTMTGASLVSVPTSSRIASLRGGSAGAGEGQYYSAGVVAVASWIPQYHKARGKPGS
jgi:hypothetical protein